MLVNKVTVGIIDDNDLVKKVLLTYFRLHSEPTFEVVFERSYLNGIWNSWEVDTLPQVILLDNDIPGIKGSDGIPLLMNLFPNASIIMFTSVEDEFIMLKSIMAGAKGYLTKDTTLLVLTESILSVIKGGICISAYFNKALTDYLLFKTDLLDQLSIRERSIIRRLGRGADFKSISYRHQLSIVNVQSAVRTVYRKLNITTRHDCLLWLKRPDLSQGSCGS